MYYYCYPRQRSEQYKSPLAACSLPSQLGGGVSGSKLLGNLLLCMCFMNSFTSESEMIRELNMGTGCPASAQLGILLPLFFNSRKLVSKLSSPFWGRLQNPKRWRQWEPPPLFSVTFCRTETKGNSHEIIPVQIKVYLLQNLGNNWMLFLEFASTENLL